MYIQFSVDGSSNSLIRYLHLENGLRGASSNNRLDLYYEGLYHRAYPTTFELIANGNVISTWEAEPLTRVGKVKAANTSATWSDISVSDDVIYWQGDTLTPLADIITDMLGQTKNSMRVIGPDSETLCDVYELRVKAYGDSSSSSYDGSTLIYIPHNEDILINFWFNMLAVDDDGSVQGIKLEFAEVIPEEIPNVETYRVALKKIATNQFYSNDFS